MRLVIAVLLAISAFAAVKEAPTLVRGSVKMQTRGGAMFVKACAYVVEVQEGDQAILWTVGGCGAGLEAGKEYEFAATANGLGLRAADGKVRWLKVYGKTVRPVAPKAP
jgi:hypothetical protein